MNLATHVFCGYYWIQQSLSLFTKNFLFFLCVIDLSYRCQPGIGGVNCTETVELCDKMDPCAHSHRCDIDGGVAKCICSEGELHQFYQVYTHEQ